MRPKPLAPFPWPTDVRYAAKLVGCELPERIPEYLAQKGLIIGNPYSSPHVGRPLRDAAERVQGKRSSVTWCLWAARACRGANGASLADGGSVPLATLLESVALGEVERMGRGPKGFRELISCVSSGRKRQYRSYFLDLIAYNTGKSAILSLETMEVSLVEPPITSPGF